MAKSTIRSGAIALSIALLLSVPAVSSAAQEKFKVQVAYSDLNLDSNVGVAVLYQRMKNASEKACGSSDYRESGSFKAAQLAKACAKDVLTSLVEKADNEKLSKIHNS